MKTLADARCFVCSTHDARLRSQFVFSVFLHSYVRYLFFFIYYVPVTCCVRSYKYDLVSYLPLVLLSDSQKYDVMMKVQKVRESVSENQRGNNGHWM